MARIPTKRQRITEQDLRAMFMEGSRMVLEYRDRFDREFEAAETDSERHALVKSFPRDLAKMYSRIDGILDAYLEMKTSEQLH